jgi:hypothetical protein
VQKEVAERIIDIKESILSLSVKAYGTPKKVMTTPKKKTPNTNVNTNAEHNTTANLGVASFSCDVNLVVESALKAVESHTILQRTRDELSFDSKSLII